MIAVSAIVLLSQIQVTVPRGSAPELDGIVQPGEWAHAATVAMPGATIRIIRADRGVYVLIEAQSSGIGHLCVAHGDTVRVLQASASLGAATYVRAATTWKNAQSFVWRVRDRDGRSAPAPESQQHLIDHRWTATTVAAGARVREFQLDTSWFTPSSHIAALWLGRHRDLAGRSRRWLRRYASGDGQHRSAVVV